MSQEDFMHKDQCIIVDFNDKVIGHETKLVAHQFSQSTVRFL